MESAAKLVGTQCRWLSMDQEVSGKYGNWNEEDAIIFRGSFEAAESFREARPNAKPGVIGDQSGLNCVIYYPKYGEHLLNSEHIYVAVGELRHYWKDLRAKFASHDLFVRPDMGAKAFSGQLVSGLEQFLVRERPYLSAMNPSDLCLVAPLKQVEAGYRLVVVNSKVIAGSQYKLDTVKIQDEYVPEVILDFGKRMASEVKLSESSYMLDIALEKSSRLSEIQVNSFSSSDFYEADLNTVVGAVEAMIAKDR